MKVLNLVTALFVLAVSANAAVVDTNRECRRRCERRESECHRDNDGSRSSRHCDGVYSELPPCPATYFLSIRRSRMPYH